MVFRRSLLTLVFFLVASSSQEEGSCDAGNPDDRCHLPPKSGAEVGTPSKAVKLPRGRLGNHMVSYLEALAIDAVFPVETLVTRETRFSTGCLTPHPPPKKKQPHNPLIPQQNN